MDIAVVLRDIAVMFVAAKVLGALFRRVGQAPVIGELLAGVIFGAHALGWVGESETHEALQELGAVVLMFAVGLDTPPSDLKAVGRRSLGVGVGGVAVPFAGGLALWLALGEPTSTALFMGTAMVATSVGITARVLADLGRVREPESRVILGAAVVDDVLGLLVLGVVAGSVAGTLTVASVAWLAFVSLAFVALVGGLGARSVRALQPILDRVGNGGVFVVAVGLCLGLAAFADALQLAAIIGAFLAGMAFAETRDHYELERRVEPLYSFLVPFFFFVTGAKVDLTTIDAGTAWLTLAVVVVAIAGKLIGCGVAAAGMGRRSAAIIGVGMVPRGEVGIVVASLGLTRGIIDNDVYVIVVTMSVVTTLVVGPVLGYLFRGTEKQKPRPPARTDEIEGIGG